MINKTLINKLKGISKETLQEEKQKCMLIIIKVGRRWKNVPKNENNNKICSKWQNLINSL